jgi:uncharacterized membrane protein YkvA (DUF1232 family)
MSEDDQLTVLQRFVNSFPQDLLAVREALNDPATPAAAQRFLIGGLNYALDMLDIFPDHFKGIGIADDAIVLRLSAKLARDAGASHPAIDKLATDANLVIPLFDGHAAPLEQLVAQFPDREVRGRTADKILGHKDTRVMFDADIGREAKRHQPQQIGGTDGASRAISELHKMVEHALRRAKLIP